MDNSESIFSKKFTFPFDTCEIPQKNAPIAQPFSFAVNLIIISVIVYFLFQCKTTLNFLVIFSLFCFELSHTFAHAVHIPGKIQFIVTHTAVLFTIIFLSYLLYKRTNRVPSWPYLVAYFAILVIDLAVILYDLPFILDLVFYLLLFVLVLGYYYSYLPDKKRGDMQILLGLFVVIFGLELNEFYHCSQWLKWWPQFPLHIFVESFGIFPIYYLCRIFYDY
jgi:hypothetical protein